DADAREIAGTVDYMAPEQLHGAPPSAPADCYGLGVVLYSALAGRLPFASAAAHLAIRRVGGRARAGHTTPAAPGSAAPDLDALALELLDENPERRPTAEAVR